MSRRTPGKVTFGSPRETAQTPHLTGMMFQGMTDTAHGTRAISRRESGTQRHDRRSCRRFSSATSRRAVRRSGTEGSRSWRSPTPIAPPCFPKYRQPRKPACRAWCPPAGLRSPPPPKTPQPLASEIAKAAVETIKMPDVQAKFRAASVEPVGNSPEEMAAFHRPQRHGVGATSLKRTILSWIESCRLPSDDRRKGGTVPRLAPYRRQRSAQPSA